jgi:hypothetical protein
MKKGQTRSGFLPLPFAKSAAVFANLLSMRTSRSLGFKRFVLFFSCFANHFQSFQPDGIEDDIVFQLYNCFDRLDKLPPQKQRVEQCLLPTFLEPFSLSAASQVPCPEATVWQKRHNLCCKMGLCRVSEFVQDFAFPRTGLCSSLEFDQEFGFPELVFRGSEPSHSYLNHWNMISRSK